MTDSVRLAPQAFLIGVDAGKKTGLATADFHADGVTFGFTSAEWDWLGALSMVEAMLRAQRGRPVYVVAEAYDPRRGVDHGHWWTIRSNGALEYLCHEYGATYLPEQKPRDAKHVVSDKRLRQLGWYRPSDGGHMNDAARHLGLVLVKARLLRFSDLGYAT